jgi:protein-tyrosine phosphatase
MRATQPRPPQAGASGVSAYDIARKVPICMIVDLHSHFVPGVDDGASSVEEAVLALERMAAEHVVRVVTTPHLLLPYLRSAVEVERELDRHRRSFDELATALLGSAGRVPDVRLGQEIWAPDAATLRRALRIPGLGLGGSEWLLVEFGFDLRGNHLDVVQEALGAGWRIIVAHPERYRPVEGSDLREIAAAWQEAGALLQVNAGSLGGHYLRSSPDSRELAWSLVEQGLAGLVATDHHGAGRPVSVTEAWDLLVARGGEPLARRLMVETPSAIAGVRPLCPSAAPPV